MGALALMNLSGLFMERGVKHEWGGVLSAMLLSMVLVPFQAYAALKGLLAVKEGGWFRTPKSGKITEFFDRLDLGGKLRWLLPRRRGRRRKGRVSKATDVGGFSWLTRRRSRLAYGLISVMLAGTLIVGSMTVRVPMVEAAVGTSTTFYFGNSTEFGTYSMNQTQYTGTETETIATVNFYSDVWSATDANILEAGTATVYFNCTLDAAGAADVTYKLYGGSTLLGTSATTVASAGLFTVSWSHAGYSFGSTERLRLEMTIVQTGNVGKSRYAHFKWDGASNDSRLTTGTIVPERLLGLLLVVPAFPFLARKINLRRRHRARSRC